MRKSFDQRIGKIPLETIHNLHESLPRRIEAVINAKGGPTPY